MPSFCRHGRLEANCPICSKKAGPSTSPVRPARRAAPRTPAAQSVAARRRASRGAGDLRVRRLSRAADDGYDHELVPGVRATADAALLADELAFSAARLDELATAPPGLYAEVASEQDAEEALWLAFLIAHLGPLPGEDPWEAVAQARVPWSTGEVPDLAGVAIGPRGSGDPRTPAAYRAWAARAGAQRAALEGDAAWDAGRRFNRAFERLALPGFGRAQRYELLTILRHLGVLDVQPTSLALQSEPMDATVLAAKRAFGIGDPTELRRRAARLAGELRVPIETLDLALVNWNRPPSQPRITAGATVEADPGRRERFADALDAHADDEPPPDAA